MDRIQITESELLDALRAAASSGGVEAEGALTTREIMTATGWGEERVRRVLRPLVEAGTVEVIRVRRANMVGVTGPTPAFRTKGR